ncbi:hypothetical protein [Aeromonas allosaccharophila]|uniref:hypothetical protein n=1 Tax=Aeromonas allosaccharophila TaxID=656 RepID=UPI002B47F16B|nr:hypothetical protein [Aeromonas allosaccharophila]
MSYIWNDFGVLAGVCENEDSFFVVNTEAQARKISKYAFKESAVDVAQTAKSMIGCKVRLRTSQNTVKWSPEVWFSGIEKVN